ncbi:MAG: ABC-2 family transporter protein [Verrucomicrobia bacterium]|nr:ABC-2 family transporter protein [Verrucomicrobiota bacterium]
MKSYIAILRARLLTLLQYRKAAFAGICTQMFWALIFNMIFIAFYRGAHTSASTIPLHVTLTFNWINQAFWLLIPWNIDKEIERQIKVGSIAYELIRPLNLYWFLFSRAAAVRIAPLILRTIPYFLLSALFLTVYPVELAHPQSLATLCTFVASIGCSLILSSAITTLICLSLFWTLSGEGIVRILPNITILLSGLIVPLPLFPSWLQPFLEVQPIRGILDIPCRIYTGLIPLEQSGYYLAFQLAWAAIAIVLGSYVSKRAIGKLQIQGG